MDSGIEPSVMYRLVAPNRRLQRSDLKIALQSAFAAALCFGLPTGLFFWLISIQRWTPSASMGRLVDYFSRYLVPPDLLEILGAFGWGLLLSKISGYRKWWWLSLVTVAGVKLGTFVLYSALLSEWFLAYIPPDVSFHARFGIILASAVLCVTVSTGLMLGFVLMNWRASLTLAVSTGLVSVLASVIIVMIMGELGIRVGSGNAAMPKVTAAATMAAALAGGAILGVMFTHYARIGSPEENAIDD